MTARFFWFLSLKEQSCLCLFFLPLSISNLWTNLIGFIFKMHLNSNHFSLFLRLEPWACPDYLTPGLFQESSDWYLWSTSTQQLEQYSQILNGIKAFLESKHSLAIHFSQSKYCSAGLLYLCDISYYSNHCLRSSSHPHTTFLFSWITRYILPQPLSPDIHRLVFSPFQTFDSIQSLSQWTLN